MVENSSKVLHDVDPHHHDDDWRRYHWYYAGGCLLCSRLFIFRPLLQLVAIQGVSLVNFWYPLIATIACVHEQRHPSTTSTTTQEEEEVRQIIIDQKLSSTASRSAADTDHSSRGRSIDVVSSDNGNVKKSELSAAATASTTNNDCHFWFEYWNVYALVQTMDQVLLLIFSILFRDLIPQRNQFMAEMQLFFAIYYLFVMKKPTTVSSSSFDYYQEWVQPYILHGHEMISEAISEDAWTNLFASRIEQLMDLMVNIHLMAQPMKDQIVIILKEGRTLIVPATLTLLPITPMFFTRLGVVYSQYLLPVGKAAITTNKKNKNVMVTNHGKEKEEKEEQTNIRQLHHYLKYWILHSCVSIFFQALSFFWWMPFYHHGMFLFWSYLSFDTTIVEYYNVLELDLISLGILPSGDNSKVEVHQTQTYQFLTAIAKRLPSADEATFQDLLEEEEEEKVVVVETKKHSSRTISTSSSSTTTTNTNTTTTTDDRVSVEQLKSLIRQLPANQKDLNMDDDETAQILKMLIAKLKKEEAKTTTTTAADAGIILDDDDDDDDDDDEVLVDSKQQVNKLEKETTFVSKMVKVDMSGRKLSPIRGESNNTNDDNDEEVFFETRRDLSINDQHQVARSPPIVARIGNNNNNKNYKKENKLEEKKRRLRVGRNNNNNVSSERTSDDSMANKNTTTSNSDNDDDDFFDAKEKSERRMTSKSRKVQNDELPASAVRSPVHHGGNRPKEKKKEKSEEKQGRGAHNETLLVSESSCDTVVTDALQSNNNSEDSFDVNDDEHIMPSSELLRRSKRERAGLLSKQSSSTRFVSKLLVRIESNQKAKRKEKREKLKEKKKEKVQNNKNTQ